MSATRPRFSAVIFPDRHEAQVRATLRSLAAQRDVSVETLLVTDRGNRRARPLLEDLSGARVQLLEVEAPTRSAARAAGARRAAGEQILFPLPGDTFDAHYLARAAGILKAEADVALVSAWSRLERGLGESLCASEEPSLEALLVDPWTLAEASVVRRAAFEAAGGLDPELPALELYDLWLRVLSGGQRARLIELPLLSQPAGPESPLRADLDPALHERAFARVFEKHRGLFTHHGLLVLQGRERRLHEASRRHTALVARREATQHELERLKAEAERLRQALAQKGDPGVDWGELRRTRPLDPNWGYSRGAPVDRYYIERFLERHALDVQGAVLEVQEGDYTRRFGGERVVRSDVLDLSARNPRANVIADLRSAPSILDASYDCVILTQTAHVVDDVAAVLHELRRILKPGGTLLATFPAASRVCLEYGRDGDFWRVTEAGARRLAEDAFGSGQVQTESFGNVLTNAAFLYGLGREELRPDEFEAADPFYPLVIGVRATKRGPKPARWAGRPGNAAAVLLYHRVATSVHDHHGLSVPSELFEAQLSHLRRSCNVLPLRELVERATRDDLPPRAVALTFDDGYVDNLTQASPRLVDLSLPATFFITAEGLDGKEFWWDVLERTLLQSGPAAAELQLGFAGGPEAVRVATRDERAACHDALHARLLAAPLEERDAVVAALLAWSGQLLSADPERRPLDASGLRRLAARPGHEIGGHGYSHRALVGLGDGDKRHEFREGKRVLEAVLGGGAIRAWAYPFGAFDAATLAIAREEPVEVALTCEPSLVRAGVDRLRLGRFEVKAWPLAEFAAWLDGIFAGSREAARA